MCSGTLLDNIFRDVIEGVVGTASDDAGCGVIEEVVGVYGVFSRAEVGGDDSTFTERPSNLGLVFEDEEELAEVG